MSERIVIAKVIGRFEYEGNANESQIYELLKAHLGNAMRYLHFTFRGPAENRRIANSQERPDMGNRTTGWHRDGGGPWMLIWSNREATEVLPALGPARVRRFKPYDVVLINNVYALHRTPLPMSPDRLFWRLASVPEDIKWLP